MKLVWTDYGTTTCQRTHCDQTKRYNNRQRNGPITCKVSICESTCTEQRINQYTNFTICGVLQQPTSVLGQMLFYLRLWLQHVIFPVSIQTFNHNRRFGCQVELTLSIIFFTLLLGLIKACRVLKLQSGKFFLRFRRVCHSLEPRHSLERSDPINSNHG
jgi:hypothetical protein